MVKHQIDDESEGERRRPQRDCDTSDARVRRLAYIVGRYRSGDKDGVENERYADGGEHHMNPEERQVDVRVERFRSRKLRQTCVRKTDEVEGEEDKEKRRRRSHETRVSPHVSASYRTVSREDGHESRGYEDGVYVRYSDEYTVGQTRYGVDTAA